MATRITSPKGFPEYLPKDQIKFDYLRNKIAETYASFGFYHIATPAVEYMKTLSSTGDVSKEIYAIKRAKGEGEEEANSDNERGLRFDLTKPLARYTAEHYNELTFPFKRYQIQPVWRGERPQKGRLREFYQADVDIIGNGTLSVGHDFETLATIGSTLNTLNIGKFRIRINDREVLQAVVNKFGVKSENFAQALIIIDKLDKIGVEEVSKLITEQIGLSSKEAQSIGDFITQKNDSLSIVEQNEDLKALLERLDILVASLNALNLDNITFVKDFSIARGLDYYTGMVFETHLEGFENYGSLASGGRYENLAREFTNHKLPGVGGSIGLSRLYTLIQNEGILLPIELTKKSYFVTYFENNNTNSIQKFAQTLRETNSIVQIAPEAIKLDKALKYAISSHVNFLIILEQDGTLTEKNLQTHAQKKFENIGNYLIEFDNS
jgi:histidyl-tRNA synthetase